MNALEISRREAAAWRTRDHIRAVAVTAFGAGEVVERIEGFSDLTRTVLDDPVAGVRAARLVWSVATGALRKWALRARGAGAGWDAVAAALELSDHDGHSPAEAAWEWLVEHRPPGPSRTTSTSPSAAVWTCTTCRERVRDTGPFASHPDDREHGHAEDCSRRAAALETWRRTEGDDDV